MFKKIFLTLSVILMAVTAQATTKTGPFATAGSVGTSTLQDNAIIDSKVAAGANIQQSKIESLEADFAQVAIDTTAIAAGGSGVCVEGASGPGSIDCGVGSDVSGGTATVSGGTSNTASGSFSAIAGGTVNSADGSQAFIGGGTANTASASDSAVAGGSSNKATGSRSYVGGGTFNIASGDGAAISGGYTNAAQGGMSWAGGNRAKSRAKGSYTWADSQESDLENNVTDQFLIRAQGGFRVESSSNQFTGSIEVLTSSITANTFFAESLDDLLDPAYSFTGDSDTGISRVGANTIAFITGGTLVFEGSPSKIMSEREHHMTFGIRNDEGTAANPSYRFISNTNMGMYRVGNSTLGFSTEGLLRFSIDASGKVVVENDLEVKGFIDASASSITANQFFGDGSQLTGINGGASVIGSSESVAVIMLGTTEVIVSTLTVILNGSKNIRGTVTVGIVNGSGGNKLYDVDVRRNGTTLLMQPWQLTIGNGNDGIVSFSFGESSTLSGSVDYTIVIVSDSGGTQNVEHTYIELEEK